MSCVTYAGILAPARPAGRLKMVRTTYLYTGPQPQRKEPGVGSSWPKEEQTEAFIRDIKHHAVLAQVEGSLLSVSDKIEFEGEQLIGLRNFLTTIAESGPGYYSRLVLPACGIWQAADKLEGFISPGWREVKRRKDA